MDEITIKKLKIEKPELYNIKAKVIKKKNNLPKEKRTFQLSLQEKYNKNFPAPNKYLPQYIDKTYKATTISYKKYM